MRTLLILTLSMAAASISRAAEMPGPSPKTTWGFVTEVQTAPSGSVQLVLETESGARTLWVPPAESSYSDAEALQRGDWVRADFLASNTDTAREVDQVTALRNLSKPIGPTQPAP